MTWICKCGGKNSGLNMLCAWKSYDEQHLRVTEHIQVSVNTLDSLRIYVALKEITKQVNPNEELFAKYYNRGKILVKDMNDTELREHRESLVQVATEAKATLLAADDEIRERSAKKRLKDKEWIVPVDTNQSVSDSLAVVKARGGRLNKIEKARAGLLAAGIDEETVKEMISNMERKATDSQLKTVTFKAQSVETKAIQVKIDKPSDSKPFDFSSILKKKD